MTSRTIVVVGAGLAGLRASEQLRACGWTERIVVIGGESHPPYNRPPLTKAALRDGVDVRRLAFRHRPATADVEWRLGTTVAATNLASRTVTLEDGSVMRFDGLVIATGVSARRLPLDSPKAWRHSVRTVEDAAALREVLVKGVRLVIIGGGFIGCEIAATAVSLHCRVAVVEPLNVPLEGPIGRMLGAEIQRRHEGHGVRFHTGRTVTALQGDPARGSTTVVLDNNTILEADAIVEAVGSTANTSWLDGQGLDLADGVLCDADLHPVGADGPVLAVVALGDVARFPLPLADHVCMRIEHWTMPTDTAGHAARSLIAGIDGALPPMEPPFHPIPTFWSEQYGTRIHAFGVPAHGREDVRVLEGDCSDEAALGYYHDGVLVGVVLLDMGKQMSSYRQILIDANAPTP